MVFASLGAIQLKFSSPPWTLKLDPLQLSTTLKMHRQLEKILFPLSEPGASAPGSSVKTVLLGSLELILVLGANVGIPLRLRRPWIQIGQRFAWIGFREVLLVVITRERIRA